MNNPFEVIDARLSNIEDLLLDLKHNPKVRGEQPEQRKNLSLDEGCAFLKENGYNVSKSYLYKKTMNNSIPVRRFGHRIIFDRNELLLWAEGRLKGKGDNPVTMAAAKSVSRKMKKG